MHFPARKGEVSTQMRPIGLQTDIQRKGESAHAGKHFQNSLQMYLHIIMVLKLPLGRCVTVAR